ncbi:MAG: thermonuclease family protein [Pseudomonadota bacterium]|nr:thermonuclease family protein [Pseudomonadota bacterium]
MVDGDTVWIGDHNIRFAIVDAPEMRTPEGPVAKQYLVDLIADRPLTCRVTSRDRYNRDVAICSVDGVMIDEALLRACQARILPRYMIAGERARLEDAASMCRR